MSKVDAERVKAESRGLRGSIAAEIAAPTPRFSEESATLLKFHGTYQQEDRDARKGARAGEGEKQWSFMVRVKATGGHVPAALWSAVDELADRHGNGTIRVTTRQGLQLHGVRKDDLRPVIADIVAHLGSTLATCGDVVRNVMAPPWPYAHPAYQHARETAAAVSRELVPQSGAYAEIWQDGEAVYSGAPADEPLYGATYLPRKFKIAVTVPGDNSVDLYTNDLGIVPVFGEDGEPVAYDITAGGGLGRTHGKKTTYPRLADHLGSVAPAQLLEAVRAIVVVQRDYGDRTDRRHARLKYLIADRGLDWFRAEVEREAGFALGPWRALPPWEDMAHFGWHAQGEGRWFLGLHVASGRVRDDGPRRLKSALRALADRGFAFVATPGQQLLVVDVAADARDGVDQVLRAHGVEAPEGTSPVRRHALACPALPTCGLALAESERVVPALLDAVEAELAAAGLAGEGIGIRMTGCPNGCARPYMAEVGIVGQSPDRYQLYLGGSPHSTRLATLWREGVRLAEIARCSERCSRRSRRSAAAASRSATGARARSSARRWRPARCAHEARGRLACAARRDHRARGGRAVRGPDRAGVLVRRALGDGAARSGPARPEPGLPVHYVDTGLLFPQTHALVERAARRYGIEPIAVRPALSVDEQAQRLGPALWERDPDRCCDLRKVRPHRAFLGGYDAWLTGIRRVQSAARRELEPVAPDGAALVKISPLFDWSDDDVWAYAIEHDVPVNALHAQGYPSIGCGPCTRAVAPGEDARAGRWAGFAKTECGLHQRAEARG